MRNILNKPWVLNGLLAGAVLLAIKLVLAYSGNWMFRLQPLYNMMAFLIILVAMFLGGFGEKKISHEFSFLKAWLTCVYIIAIAVFISLVGDQIAYRSVSGLAEKTKEFNMEQLVQGFEKTSFFSGKMKEMLIDNAEKMEPSEIYSVFSSITSWVTFTLFNSLWALMVAGIIRKKNNEYFKPIDTE